METKIIDGKAHAAKLRADIQAEVAEFIAQKNIQPSLAVILVGNDPASEVYVRNKGIQTREVGMNSIEIKLPENISEEDLLFEIKRLNEDASVHGILVQLPLPSHIDSNKVLNSINPNKDVDGFHPQNVGRLWTSEALTVPCTPLGCSILLQEYCGDLSGKSALVVGRSNIVGKPMAALLLDLNATVTIAHSKTKNLEELCRQADIVIAAVGRPEMLRGSWFKEGAIVLDVGINRIEKDGQKRLVGDVAFDEALPMVAKITPVPGGIGPMTIACLLRNTLQCARLLSQN